MGKDLFNGNWGVFIKIAILILALGAAGQMLRSHDVRIGDVEEKAHETELKANDNAKDVGYLGEKIDNLAGEMTEQRKSFDKLTERLPKNE